MTVAPRCPDAGKCKRERLLTATTDDGRLAASKRGTHLRFVDPITNPLPIITRDIKLRDTNEQQ